MPQVSRSCLFLETKAAVQRYSIWHLVLSPLSLCIVPLGLFPLEVAMIISSLWAENLDDVFQSLVFPAVPADQYCTSSILAFEFLMRRFRSFFC